MHSPIRTGSIPGQASHRVSSRARPASRSAVSPPNPRVAFHTGLQEADAGSVSTGGQVSLGDKKKNIVRYPRVVLESDLGLILIQLMS